MTQQQISDLIRQHVTAREIDGNLVLCGVDDAAVAIESRCEAEVHEASVREFRAGRRETVKAFAL